MARGDYVEVIHKVGTAEVARESVVARSVGASVETELPKRPTDSQFVEVREVDKAGRTVRTVRFAVSEVVAIIEGHNTITKARK